jgi:outer membrane immunogenic protein
MMRSLLAGAGLLALSTVLASAADMRRPAPYAAPYQAPYAPYFSWTGFYLGANGGYGWGDSRWNFPGGSTGDFDVAGAIFGVTAGYNFQMGAVVIGAEADVNWTNIHGNTTNNCAPGCFTNNTWLTTVRGRVGYAVDRLLPYLTGGAAIGNIKAHLGGLPEQTDERLGWTIGAGAEFAFFGNWSAKVEYLYVDLDSFSCGAAACGAPGPAEVKFDAGVLRAGVNYRF